MCKQSNLLLNNERVKEKNEIRKYFEVNADENTTHQNVKDAAKIAFGGKFVAVNDYVKKKKRNKGLSDQ